MYNISYMYLQQPTAFLDLISNFKAYTSGYILALSLTQTYNLKCYRLFVRIVITHNICTYFLTIFGTKIVVSLSITNYGHSLNFSTPLLKYSFY